MIISSRKLNETREKIMVTRINQSQKDKRHIFYPCLETTHTHPENRRGPKKSKGSKGNGKVIQQDMITAFPIYERYIHVYMI